MRDRRTSPASFLQSEDSARTMMLDYFIALIPSLIWGTYVFGLRVPVLAAIGIFTAMALDYLLCRLLRRKACFSDLSSVVIDAVITAALPVSVPLWMPAVGAAFAVVIFRHLLIASGRNFFPPALSSLSLMALIYRGYLVRLTEPFARLSPFAMEPSGKPLNLALIGDSVPLPLRDGVLSEGVSLSQLLTGSTAGGVGAVSTLLLLTGGLYLLVRRTVTWHVPVAYYAALAACAAFFPTGGMDNRWSFLLICLFSGQTAFGAVFLATDPAAVPMTPPGKIAVGLLAGALTPWACRHLGDSAGVCVAILIASLTSRFWDFLLRARVYGKKRGLISSFLALPAIFRPAVERVLALIPKKKKGE